MKPRARARPRLKEKQHPSRRPRLAIPEIGKPALETGASRAQFASAFMLSGSRLKTMLRLVRRAPLPIEARATGEAMLGGEAVSRNLAAIIAADVASYSRLMEADKEGTLARLRSLRQDLIRRSLSTRGAHSRPPGDGMLIEFANAVEAARIAAD